MGRHAGWIAAAGGLASNEDHEVPIIILFPEVTFDQESFWPKRIITSKNTAIVRL